MPPRGGDTLGLQVRRGRDAGVEKLRKELQMDDAKKGREPIYVTDQIVPNLPKRDVLVDGRPPTREQALKLGLTPPRVDSPKRKKM